MILMTLFLGVPAFFLGKVIWPDLPDAPQPSAFQLPFFIILSALQSLLFGFGVAFAIVAWPWVKKSADNIWRTRAMYFSVVWILVQWWPHDNLHRWNGFDLQGLLFIDYAFHLTVMLASVIILSFFVSTLKSQMVKKGQL
ncbi:MAG: hypothetical protein HY001_03330 [Candidatus Portnoybacteria bacterium]|nr:hypothetical protein [Candidatus Portnoybacteria bacterium]